jgi:hypothetical protein
LGHYRATTAEPHPVSLDRALERWLDSNAARVFEEARRDRPWQEGGKVNARGATYWGRARRSAAISLRSRRRHPGRHYSTVLLSVDHHERRVQQSRKDRRFTGLRGVPDAGSASLWDLHGQ